MIAPLWPTLTADAQTDAALPSLLCIDGDRSFSLAVPASGELVIGRGPEAGFRVEDPLVSRAHAHLLLGPDGLRVADLGSRHGTLVNGERIHEPRVLRAGDVVAIGGILLVARRGRAPAARPVEPAGFVQRLGEELARCAHYERELSVMVVRGRDATAIADALPGKLRAIDTTTALGPRHVGVLLPELGADEAITAAELLTSQSVADGGISIGVASAPYDGLDADELLAAARAASDRDGRPIHRATEAVETLALGGHRIVVADPAMAKLYELARRIARSTIPVLILGETGVGKELAAATVHACSPRANGPFISVNCAAIPESLAESELFGHVKGAFSGALANKVGYIEAAAGGTLFLDEIGELSATIQAKLLRVLENGELIRVGEVAPRAIDLRIVAATNRDLPKEIAAERFRSDLYFRLGAARLEIPPLRERPRDLAVLAATMLTEACQRLGRAPLELSIGAAIALFRHRWPGNIRELRHAIEYAAAASPPDASELELWHLPQPLASAARVDRDAVALPAAAPAAPAGFAAAPPPSGFRPIADEVRELERSRMVAALRVTGGLQNKAAEMIEMPLRTFVTKLKRYAITPDDWRA